MIDPDIFQRHARTGLAIDTNIMLLLFTGIFDRSMIGRFKRAQAFAPEDFDQLSTLVNRFHRVAATPNILTEVSNLSRQGSLGEKAQQRYVSAFREIIGRLDERYFESRSLSEAPSFARFGLTDQSLVQLARENWLVLTDDFRLSSWLASKQLPVINFNHLRPYFQF